MNFDDSPDYKHAKFEVIAELSVGGRRPTKGEWQAALADRRGCTVRTIRTWEAKTRGEDTRAWATRPAQSEPTLDLRRTGTD